MLAWLGVGAVSGGSRGRRSRPAARMFLTVWEAARAEGQGAGARGLEPGVAVLPPQPHDAEHGLVALLRVGAAFEDAGDERPGRRAGLLGLADEPRRRPLGVRAVGARHVPGRHGTAARRSGAGARSRGGPGRRPRRSPWCSGCWFESNLRSQYPCSSRSRTFPLRVPPGRQGSRFWPTATPSPSVVEPIEHRATSVAGQDIEGNHPPSHERPESRYPCILPAPLPDRILSAAWPACRSSAQTEWLSSNGCG